MGGMDEEAAFEAHMNRFSGSIAFDDDLLACSELLDFLHLRPVNLTLNTTES